MIQSVHKAYIHGTSDWLISHENNLCISFYTWIKCGNISGIVQTKYLHCWVSCFCKNLLIYNQMSIFFKMCIMLKHVCLTNSPNPKIFNLQWYNTEQSSKSSSFFGAGFGFFFWKLSCGVTDHQKCYEAMFLWVCARGWTQSCQWFIHELFHWSTVDGISMQRNVTMHRHRQ